jgi:hypothetical protein
MHSTWHQKALVLAGVLAIGVMLGLSRGPAARGNSDDNTAAAAHRYTVVESQAHNLLVTDNERNVLYFYAADRDKQVGAPLKLRGEIDLTQVGQSQIRLTPHNVSR